MNPVPSTIGSKPPTWPAERALTVFQLRRWTQERGGGPQMLAVTRAQWAQLVERLDHCGLIEAADFDERWRRTHPPDALGAFEHIVFIPAGGRPALSKESSMDNAPTQAPRVIAPTIGRRVWYWPNRWDVNASMTHLGVAGDPGAPGVQPFDAGVVYVWNDRMVNLDVCDHAGRHHARTSVRLVQPDDAPPEPGRDAYATWMPPQIQGTSLKEREEADARLKAYEAERPALMAEAERRRAEVASQGQA